MIKFSKAINKGWPHNKKTRRWDIRLTHNNEKVGEINKDFPTGMSPRSVHTRPNGTSSRGIHSTIKTKRFSYSLGEAKGVARAILEDKELLISILTRQRENQIARSVNQAWSAT